MTCSWFVFCKSKSLLDTIVALNNWPFTTITGKYKLQTLFLDDLSVDVTKYLHALRVV